MTMMNKKINYPIGQGDKIKLNEMEKFDFTNKYKSQNSKKYFKRKSKYNAKKVESDGYKFDSQVEYGYYLELKRRKTYFKAHKNGDKSTRFEIVNGFDLNGHYHKPRFYTPDFVVYKDANKSIIDYVVDVKPKKITSDASLRMNMFSAKWKVPVLIVKWNKKTKSFDEKDFH